MDKYVKFVCATARKIHIISPWPAAMKRHDGQIISPTLPPTGLRLPALFIHLIH